MVEHKLKKKDNGNMIKDISKKKSLNTRSGRIKAAVKSTGFTLGSLFTALNNYFVKNSINGNNLDFEDLKKAIEKRGKTYYCNEIMGVSCGDNSNGGDKYSINWDLPWEDQRPFAKWYIAGGNCPPYHITDDSCTAGCADIFGYCCPTYLCEK